MPAVDRALVHAHFDLGMSLGEVAVLHGVTPRQARRRLEALRKRLADPCFVLAVQFARRLPRRFGGIASAYWIEGRTQREIAGEEGATLHQVRKRLLSSSYTMNFNNGVKFSLYVLTSDTFPAATMSSLLNAAAMYEKVSGTAIEKQAIDDTTIDSAAGTLSVKFDASDGQFSALLQSPLFQNVVH